MKFKTKNEDRDGSRLKWHKWELLFCFMLVAIVLSGVVYAANPSSETIGSFVANVKSFGRSDDSQNEAFAKLPKDKIVTTARSYSRGTSAYVGLKPNDYYAFLQANIKRVDKTDQQKIADYFYQSVVNFAKYYNAKSSYAISDELAYSLTLHPQFSGEPLRNLSTMKANAAIGYIRELEASFLKPIYVSDDTLIILPDFAKINKYVGNYADTSLSKLLKTGATYVNQNIGVISTSKTVALDPQKTIDLLGQLVLLSVDEQGKYKDDVMSLISIGYQNMFGSFTRLPYAKQGLTSSDKGYNTLSKDYLGNLKAAIKSEGSVQTKLFRSEGKEYLKQVNSGTQNTQVRSDVRQKASILFGSNNVFIENNPLDNFNSTENRGSNPNGK